MKNPVFRIPTFSNVVVIKKICVEKESSKNIKQNNHIHKKCK